MSQAAAPDPELPESRPARRDRSRDPRVWLGLGVTVLAMWLTLRGVNPRGVMAEFRRANWPLLLAVSVPAYVAAVYLRALRWRHLTAAIRPMRTGVLFRAVAIGFMANNLFPLRMGDLVRCWVLARETGASTAALVGTVVLERVADTLCVLGLALGVILVWGGETATWQRSVLWLAPLALVPLALLVALHAAPDRVMAAFQRWLHWAPPRATAWLVRQLRGFAEGLGALRGGAQLGWVVFHSLWIWLIASTLPILAAFWALDVDFGGPGRTLAAGWMTLAAIGLAVALPSAPGFFGLYHSACRLVLERFGISAETAVAIGTLSHAVFWVTLTALGGAALRGANSGWASPPARREAQP